ncbi:hypothetical protein P4O66_007789, partial [Electrophorus voltai]
MNHTYKTENITKFCENHTCKGSYTTYFIRPIDFVDMYYKICNWNKTLPAQLNARFDYFGSQSAPKYK